MLTELPKDILRLLIREDLDFYSFYHLSLTCRLFHELCSDPVTQDCFKKRHLQFKTGWDPDYTEWYEFPNRIREGPQKVFRECYCFELINWKNGRISGPDEKYNYIGKLTGRTIWKDNRMDGPEEHWYENGRLSSRRYWTYGIANGLEEHWYSDGSLHYRINWVNGYKEELLII